MNIYKWEMKSNFKGFIIWSFFIVLMIVSSMAEFSAYHNNPQMLEVLDAMPEPLLKAFNMNAANLTTLSGFYSVLLTYMFIMLGIHSALLGTGIISKEERDKTAEFLMTMPCSRQKIMLAKFFAAVTYLIVILVILNIAVIMTGIPYQPDGDFYKFLFKSSITLFIIQMIFLALGIMLASILRHYKISGKVSLGLVFFTYILSMLMGITDKLNSFKLLTPYKYFDMIKILNGESIFGFYFFFSLLIVFVFTCVAFWIYPKRDLRL